jgi:hypothetical protein
MLAPHHADCQQGTMPMLMVVRVLHVSDNNNDFRKDVAHSLEKIRTCPGLQPPIVRFRYVPPPRPSTAARGRPLLCRQTTNRMNLIMYCRTSSTTCSSLNWPNRIKRPKKPSTVVDVMRTELRSHAGSNQGAILRRFLVQSCKSMEGLLSSKSKISLRMSLISRRRSRFFAMACVWATTGEPRMSKLPSGSKQKKQTKKKVSW